MGRAAGKQVRALLTRMDAPLGRAVGNALEVAETVAYLTGEGTREPRLHEVTMALAGEMLALGGLTPTVAAGRARAEAALADGRAAEVFARMVAALGGPADFLEHSGRYLSRAPVIRTCTAERSGHVVGMDARQIERMLYQQSGLLGVSGVSSDMRALLAAEADAAEPARQQAAREALGLYVHRVTRELGSLAAVLQGVDAIVFTAGVGENAAPIRERVMQAAAWLGVRPDLVANAKAVGLPDGRVARVSQADSRVAVWVVPTNEERMIARYTAQTLGL